MVNIRSLPYSKVLITTLSIIGIVVVGGFILIRHEAQLGKKVDSDVITVGLGRTKQECLREGKDRGECERLATSVTDTECQGSECWIVYSRTPDSHGASVTVAFRNNRYVVTDYLRDAGLK
jgi:hypothetical protein